MRVYFDLDLRQLITSPTLREAIKGLFFTRGDEPDFELQFVRGGKVVDLSIDSIFFCAKQTNSSDPLVLTAAFTKSGSGDTTVWTANPDFNTTDLDTALTSTSPLVLVGEVGYIRDGKNTTSRSFPVTIEKDLYRGDENQPEASTLAPYPSVPTAGTLLGGADDSETWEQRTPAQVLSLLGIKFGTITLSTGETNHQIAFDNAYASTPRFVSCHIAAPYGGGIVAAVPSQATVTNTGFIAVFANPIPESSTPPDPYPATGYVLHWMTIA